MEVQNQNKQDEFVTLKNCKVRNTQYTEVWAQVGTINGKKYVGLQRKRYYEDNCNPSLTSNLLPIEAWTTFVSQAVQTHEKAIKEQQA